MIDNSYEADDYRSSGGEIMFISLDYDKVKAELDKYKHEVEYFGIEIDEDVYCEIDNILREEAEYWLKDYYKHKKDYDPEVIIDEF